MGQLQSVVNRLRVTWLRGLTVFYSKYTCRRLGFKPSLRNYHKHPRLSSIYFGRLFVMFLAFASKTFVSTAIARITQGHNSVQLFPGLPRARRHGYPWPLGDRACGFLNGPARNIQYSLGADRSCL